MAIWNMFLKSPISGPFPETVNPRILIGCWWQPEAWNRRGYLFQTGLIFFTFFVISGCSQFRPAFIPEEAPNLESLVLSQPLVLSVLPGWGDGRETRALRAFILSCNRTNRLPPKQAMLPGSKVGGLARHWQEVCKKAVYLKKNTTPEEARLFFENWFYAYQVSDRENPTGLFTGYFEPLLNGSRTKTRRYSVPIYKKPQDLVSVNLGDFNKDLIGRQITGRIRNRALVPYADRSEIERGALRGKNLELVWVDDPVDAFFLQIQGSGKIRMPSGEILRVGYAGKNGRPYFAIGRELVARGILTKEQVSLQTIRAWLEANPTEAPAIMNKNRSFVFFRSVMGAGPIGAHGVPLTPGHSLAVDRRFIPLGVPLWLDTTDPLRTNIPLRRLVIAQDTGGAIKGVVRGDLFWGAGDMAREAAGKMKQHGQIYILLPRNIFPTG